GKPAIEPLIKTLEDEDANVREAVARILGEISAGSEAGVRSN
ncbi:MAG TPA: HEAT repeat domain-containing protein, partial [Armatimonadetes bacterium]|nr:HEAT repeat domain-containing protein [Armatimonadota bacterium]